MFSVHAQNSPSEAMNKASKSLKFHLSNLQSENSNSKLLEAVAFIETAGQSGELNGNIRFWLTRGDIYAKVANRTYKMYLSSATEIENLLKVENPAIIALQSYIKVLELDTNGSQFRNKNKHIQLVQDRLYFYGSYHYEKEEYAKAYENFKGVLTAHQLLTSYGMESSLNDSNAYQDLLFITGLAALNANDTGSARPLFEELHQAGYTKPVIYEALYKIGASEADEMTNEANRTEKLTQAYAYLEIGRKKYPDDTSLLFAEINHFIRTDQPEILIFNLEKAIKLEQDNLILYSTLGNVYDSLHQKEMKAENEEKAEEYFNKALHNYNIALAKDPKFIDAIHGIGSLHYNRAAIWTQRLISIEEDFSAEGQNKYVYVEAQIEKEFDKALPFFIKLEQKSPSDPNVLTALKEIFFRKNDIEKANEFNNRVQIVLNGGSLESYFKNH